MLRVPVVLPVVIPRFVVALPVLTVDPVPRDVVVAERPAEALLVDTALFLPALLPVKIRPLASLEIADPLLVMLVPPLLVGFTRLLAYLLRLWMMVWPYPGLPHPPP